MKNEELLKKINKLKICGIDISIKDIYGDTYATLEDIDSKLTRVVIPEGIKVIELGKQLSVGKKQEISLKELILPESLVTIKGYTFEHFPNLAYVRIPKNIQNIMVWAFAVCEKLNIGDVLELENIVEIGAQAFFRTGLRGRVVLGKNLSTLNSGAFQDCNIEEIDLSRCKLLRDLEDCMFQGCIKLRKVILPNTLKSIGSNCFYGCIHLE